MQTEGELASALQTVQERDREIEQEKGENIRLQDLCDELMRTLETQTTQHRGGGVEGDGPSGGQEGFAGGVSRVRRAHRARPTFGVAEKSAATEGEGAGGEVEGVVASAGEGEEGDFSAAMDSHVQKLDAILSPPAAQKGITPPSSLLPPAAAVSPLRKSSDSAQSPVPGTNVSQKKGQMGGASGSDLTENGTGFADPELDSSLDRSADLYELLEGEEGEGEG